MDIADHILPSAQTQNPFGAIDPSHNLMPTYTNSGALDTADPLSLLLLFKLLPKILHFMYRVLFYEQNQWLMTEADLIILKLDPNQNFPLMMDGSYYWVWGMPESRNSNTIYKGSDSDSLLAYLGDILLRLWFHAQVSSIKWWPWYQSRSLTDGQMDLCGGKIEKLGFSIVFILFQYVENIHFFFCNFHYFRL